MCYPKFCILNFPALGHCSAVSQLTLNKTQFQNLFFRIVLAHFGRQWGKSDLCYLFILTNALHCRSKIYLILIPYNVETINGKFLLKFRRSIHFRHCLVMLLKISEESSNNVNVKESNHQATTFLMQNCAEKHVHLNARVKRFWNNRVFLLLV